MCFSEDGAEADEKLHSQCNNRAVRTLDADADVDETVASMNLNASSLSLVSQLSCCEHLASL